MRNPLSYVFADKKPPTDTELFASLDASTFIFLSVLNDYVNKENQILEVTEMSTEETESIFRLVVDAALGNFSHISRQDLKENILRNVPLGYSELRADIQNEAYLPAPTPSRFVGEIQELLNKTALPGKRTSDNSFGILFAYIAAAFRQGKNSTLGELTEYENNLATLLFIGLHKGLEEAFQIKNLRESGNRHLAHLFMLSLILGVKVSRDNDLKGSD